MKRFFALITLATLTNSALAMAGDCPTPNESAATAFKIIKSGKGRELDDYLQRNTVAKTALNENCEDMYMLALKTKNEAARSVLEQIGYGPKNEAELNALKNKRQDSYYSYALSYSNISLIKEFKARGGKDYYFEVTKAVSFNTIDVIDWLMAENRTNIDKVFSDAVMYNRKDVVDHLIHRGADVSKGLSAALVRVARKPHDFEILELLVRAGADVNQPHLMNLAMTVSTPKTVEFLRKSGGILTQEHITIAYKYGLNDLVEYLKHQGFELQ